MKIEAFLYWILVGQVMIWLELAGGGKIMRSYLRQKRVQVWIWVIVALLMVVIVRWA